MDQFDDELLHLVDSGVTRYSALAKKANSPLSTVHIRMKKLENAGVIRNYKGDINWKKEGYVITGEADLLVKVLARDTAHLKDILLNHIDAVHGVVKTKTIVVLE